MTFEGSAFLLVIWIVSLGLLAWWIGWWLTKAERDARWERWHQSQMYWQREAAKARAEARQYERAVAGLQHDVYWLNQVVGREER